MKVAIITDIHANIEALEAVVEDARSNDVTHYVCLGDIVGYGPNPNECVKLVRSLNPSFSLMGNHDLCCTGVNMDMNSIARDAVEWTRRELDGECMEYLRHLPMTARRCKCIFVHSTLVRPETFNYFMFYGRDDHFMEQIKTGRKVCFLGHSHRAEMAVWNEEIQTAAQANPLFEFGRTAPVDLNRWTTINAGSVGQPRDHQWKATYVISEMHNWNPQSVTLRHVEYDVERTAMKIFDSTLPKYCGERLLQHKDK